MKKIWLIVTLCVCGALLMPQAAKAAGTGGILVKPGTMLHAQQALERYDAAGDAVLQYYETWMDSSRRLQREVREDGQALSYAFSGEGKHLVWEADTLKAAAEEESSVFLPDYAALKAGFGMETAVGGQLYAGRPCTAVLLENPGKDEDWIKIYLDDETGFVLFCQAPLFRLRTSVLETLPMDSRLLTPPDGLSF